VADSGAGIPDDQLDSIFDRFVTTKAAGLGMGLTVSRSIVIGHNGRLWAENNRDGGATFHLALPVEESFETPPGVDSKRLPGGAAALQTHGLTVLIADDAASFRHAVSSILTMLPGLKLIAEAADGAEALKKAAEMDPDLILLDVGLPIINGVEATTRIRKVAPRAKVLFLTQHDSPDFVDAALRAGALGYVLKVDVGSELVQAATAVLKGEQYLSSGVRHY
jgi:CheY-like chemotaxis protein